MSAPTDQTSITSAHRATGDFAQDQQTRSWILPPGIPEPHPVQIIDYAQREIAKLRRLPHGWDGADGVPFHPALANVALNFIIQLTTRPGLATPQFSPTPDGGLDIIWLVSGNRLTVGLELDEVSIQGTWADNQEAFHRFEHRWFELPRDQFEAVIGDARVFLEKISTNVAHQLPVL
jgi:hypothetical protein